MPDLFQTIECSYNQITKLPEKMSDSLQIIDCSHNQITKLPDKMPDSLQRIYCSGNKLEELPLILRINKCKINCKNINDKFYVTAINLVRRNIIKNKNKKIFRQFIICNKLFNLGFSDCSCIISQYI